jgi:uncharacterized protein
VSSRLAADRILALVDSIKTTVEQIVSRANQLNEGFHTNLVREKRKHEAQVVEHARQLTATLAEEETRYQNDLAAVRAHHERRKQRIGQAYQSSKDQRLKRIDEQVGALRWELQKQTLQGEKDRDAGLVSTAARYEAFKQELAAEQANLDRLELEAQQAFAGYGRLQQEFRTAYDQAHGTLADDENRLLAELRERLGEGRSGLTRFRGQVLLRLFRYWIVWVLLAGGIFGLVPLLQRSGVQGFGLPQAGMAAAGLMALVVGLRFLFQRQAALTADGISKALARARQLFDACREQGERHYQENLERVRNDFTNATARADQQLKKAQAEASENRVSCRMEYDERTVQLTARFERHSRARREQLVREHEQAMERLRKQGETDSRALEEAWAARQKAFHDKQSADMELLATEWKTRLQALYQDLDEARAEAERLFPPWEDPRWDRWTPPAAFSQAALLGKLEVAVPRLCETMPKERALALPGPDHLTLPLCLAYPDLGSVLFETAANGREQAIGSLNNIILRLLSTAPPGRLRFTVLDPVGLGQSFAGVMHLADYEEQLISNRIWTQSGQIEQKLADLNDHMEKVIQMYLRNEYKTIAEYNAQAGVIAEKYHFLVVADFPANFTETSVKRLLSIAASGARCGVYTLMHWDRRLPIPQDLLPDDLRKHSVTLALQGKDLLVNQKARPGTTVALAPAPTPDRATELVHQIGLASRDSSRVEVPFEHVAPAEADMWSLDTTAELRVPVGRTGATKLQYLAIGKGTRQHGLVAGKTGSGKSTLFHVIITNLGMWCSPDQVEFYLVDFKKGVEFKCYASRRLPHARVVAIESDREFGLSVLQRIDDELRRRGDLFRQLGVQDIAGYKRAGGKEPMPRTLLLIDEFQEFFVEDDKISQTASLLLDRIVRQGRAFGVHVLLGSQTLGGAYTVARTTLGQMVVRIALQCNEADAYLIMDDSNPAPRLLSRPGEGIYNDMAGAIEGNSPFQVVWLPEEVRDRYLSQIRRRADQSSHPYSEPIVFEGNAPAEVQENTELRRVLSAPYAQPVPVPRIWLGAPNSIKGPTEAAFQRQSGNHLLIVGQREEAILAMFGLGLLALAAQYPPGGVRLILADATAPGTPARAFLEQVVAALPHPVTFAKPGDMTGIMKELAGIMAERAELPDPDAAPPVFLFLHGLQRFSRLRYEEDFSFSSGSGDAEASPAATLNQLLCEGARLGLHVIAACDSYSSVTRFLSRKALSEIELRVLFQMSANDSASLIDNPKTGLLGLHRAVFFNAQEGQLETFRPYALPDPDWIDQARRQLASRTPTHT